MVKLETVHKLIKAQLEARATEMEAKAARLARHKAKQEQRRAIDMEVGRPQGCSGQPEGQGKDLAAHAVEVCSVQPRAGEMAWGRLGVGACAFL